MFGGEWGRGGDGAGVLKNRFRGTSESVSLEELPPRMVTNESSLSGSPESRI